MGNGLGRVIRLWFLRLICILRGRMMVRSRLFGTIRRMRRLSSFSDWLLRRGGSRKSRSGILRIGGLRWINSKRFGPSSLQRTKGRSSETLASLSLTMYCPSLTLYLTIVTWSHFPRHRGSISQLQRFLGRFFSAIDRMGTRRVRSLPQNVWPISLRQYQGEQRTCPRVESQSLRFI